MSDGGVAGGDCFSSGTRFAMTALEVEVPRMKEEVDDRDVGVGVFVDVGIFVAVGVGVGVLVGVGVGVWVEIVEVGEEIFVRIGVIS